MASSAAAGSGGVEKEEVARLGDIHERSDDLCLPPPPMTRVVVGQPFPSLPTTRSGGGGSAAGGGLWRYGLLGRSGVSASAASHDAQPSVVGDAAAVLNEDAAINHHLRSAAQTSVAVGGGAVSGLSRHQAAGQSDVPLPALLARYYHLGEQGEAVSAVAEGSDCQPDQLVDQLMQLLQSHIRTHQQVGLEILLRALGETSTRSSSSSCGSEKYPHTCLCSEPQQQEHQLGSDSGCTRDIGMRDLLWRRITSHAAVEDEEGKPDTPAPSIISHLCHIYTSARTPMLCLMVVRALLLLLSARSGTGREGCEGYHMEADLADQLTWCSVGPGFTTSCCDPVDEQSGGGGGGSSTYSSASYKSMVKACREADLTSCLLRNISVYMSPMEGEEQHSAGGGPPSHRERETALVVLLLATIGDDDGDTDEAEGKQLRARDSTAAALSASAWWRSVVMAQLSQWVMGESDVDDEGSSDLEGLVKLIPLLLLLHRVYQHNGEALATLLSLPSHGDGDEEDEDSNMIVELTQLFIARITTLSIAPCPSLTWLQVSAVGLAQLWLSDFLSSSSSRALTQVVTGMADVLLTSGGLSVGSAVVLERWLVCRSLDPAAGPHAMRGMMREAAMTIVEMDVAAAKKDKDQANGEGSAVWRTYFTAVSRSFLATYTALTTSLPAKQQHWQPLGCSSFAQMLLHQPASPACWWRAVVGQWNPGQEHFERLYTPWLQSGALPSLCPQHSILRPQRDASCLGAAAGGGLLLVSLRSSAQTSTIRCLAALVSYSAGSDDSCAKPPSSSNGISAAQRSSLCSRLNSVLILYADRCFEIPNRAEVRLGSLEMRLVYHVLQMSVSLLGMEKSDDEVVDPSTRSSSVSLRLLHVGSLFFIHSLSRSVMLREQDTELQYFPTAWCAAAAGLHGGQGGGGLDALLERKAASFQGMRLPQEQRAFFASIGLQTVMGSAVMATAAAAKQTSAAAAQVKVMLTGSPCGWAMAPLTEWVRLPPRSGQQQQQQPGEVIDEEDAAEREARMGLLIVWWSEWLLYALSLDQRMKEVLDLDAMLAHLLGMYITSIDDGSTLSLALLPPVAHAAVMKVLGRLSLALVGSSCSASGVGLYSPSAVLALKTRLSARVNPNAEMSLPPLVYISSLHLFAMLWVQQWQQRRNSSTNGDDEEEDPCVHLLYVLLHTPVIQRAPSARSAEGSGDEASVEADEAKLWERVVAWRAAATVPSLVKPVSLNAITSYLKQVTPFLLRRCCGSAGLALRDEEPPQQETVDKDIPAAAVQLLTEYLLDVFVASRKMGGQAQWPLRPFEVSVLTAETAVLRAAGGSHWKRRLEWIG